MQIVYSGTYEFPTKLFKTRRTFHFKSLDERTEFEAKAGGFGVTRVSTDIENLLTVNEALNEMSVEIQRCNEIAEGRA